MASPGSPTVNVLPFIPSDPNYSFDTTLNDTQYFFDVHWNERDQAWYFDMYDSDSSPIVQGVKIVIGANLGRQSPHPFFNDNLLTAVDLSQSYLDAGFDDMGVRVQVQHYTTLALAHALQIN